MLHGVQENYKSLNKKYNELKKNSDFEINNKIKNAKVISKIQNENIKLNKKIKDLEKFIRKNELTEKYLIDSEKNKNNKKVQKHER